MKKIVSFFGENSELFRELNQKAEEYAAALGLEYEWILQQPYCKEKVIEELQHADAGIIDVEPYGEDIFTLIKDRTRLLVRFGVGFDQVDLKSASQNGIAIARTTGANTTAVAEMALTLMLSCRRRIAQAQTRVRSGAWIKDVGNEIIGSTVGIVGFGAIGRRLARLLSGFDCRLIAYDPFPDENVFRQLEVEAVSLDTLFLESDCISIHVPYTPETHHLVNAKRLKMMKKTAVLVNTARGNIVDEDALYMALKMGEISGAGLDVFAREPLPETSELLTMDNVILTPHVSSQTVESLWNIYKMAIDISADFFAGKASEHILNQDYKKYGNCSVQAEALAAETVKI